MSKNTNNPLTSSSSSTVTTTTVSTLGKRKLNDGVSSDETSPTSSVVSLSSSKDSTRTGSTLKTPKPQCQLPPISNLLHPVYTEPFQIHNSRTFMPMIPYYYHHKQFGIESCMLQLEAQTKFNNYYYL